MRLFDLVIYEELLSLLYVIPKRSMSKFQIAPFVENKFLGRCHFIPMYTEKKKNILRQKGMNRFKMHFYNLLWILDNNTYDTTVSIIHNFLHSVL